MDSNFFPLPRAEGGRRMRSGEGSLSSFGVSRSDMSDCFAGPRLFVVMGGRAAELNRCATISTAILLFRTLASITAPCSVKA